MFLVLSPNLLRVPHILLLWLLNPLLNRKKTRVGMLVWFHVMLAPRPLRRSLCSCHTPVPSLPCPSGPGMQHNEHLTHPVDFTSKPFPALASFSEPARHFWASLTCAMETALDSYFQSLDTLSVAFSNSLSLTSISSSLWGRMCPHYIQYTISQGRWAVEMLVQVHCSPC